MYIFVFFSNLMYKTESPALHYYKIVLHIYSLIYIL